MNDGWYIVGRYRFRLSDHAQDRYVERVRTSLSRKQAAKELSHVLRYATVSADPPEWAVTSREDASCWVLLSDCAAFPVVDRTLTTCITPDSVSEFTRERRSERRSKRVPKRSRKPWVLRGEDARDFRRRRDELRTRSSSR